MLSQLLQYPILILCDIILNTRNPGSEIEKQNFFRGSEKVWLWSAYYNGVAYVLVCGRKAIVVPCFWLPFDAS